MKVFYDEGSINIRGTIIEVKDVKRISASGQLDDMITFAKQNHFRLEIWTDAPVPGTGRLKDAVDKGTVKFVPLPRRR